MFRLSPLSAHIKLIVKITRLPSHAIADGGWILTMAFGERRSTIISAG